MCEVHWKKKRREVGRNSIHLYLSEFFFFVVIIEKNWWVGRDCCFSVRWSYIDGKKRILYVKIYIKNQTYLFMTAVNWTHV